METTSTASNAIIDYAKSQIPIGISNLKTQLDTLSVLTKNVIDSPDTTDSDSIEYLLMVTDSFVQWSTYLRDDIKLLVASVSK